MKKLKLFTSLISLFMVVGCSCSNNENSESNNNETTVENNNGGLVTPPNGGENNNNNNTNEGENNQGNNNQGNENQGNNNGGENYENKDVLIESLTFSKSTLELAINRGYQVEYEIKPNTATNKNLRWTSTDYEVATPSPKAVILPSLVTAATS